MAYADAVKAGVGIDPNKRAYHMFIKRSITFTVFVYDSDAEGPRAALDPPKIQEAVLRFHDKPWDVDRHRNSRASMGLYSRPLMGHAATTHRHQTSYHPRSRAGIKGSHAQEPWEEETSRLKIATSPMTGTNRRGNNTQLKSMTTGKRMLIWKPSWLECLTGFIGMCWTRMFLIHTWKKSALLTRTCTKP